MTGTYASFKGKLKVGDRVRDAGKDLACNILADSKAHIITMVDEAGVCIEYCFHGWDEPGTLELLSPSPRVVTLESIQPGDRIRKETNTSLSDLTCLDVSKNGKVGFFFITDKETHGLITLTIGSLIKDGYQPIQPASPPAPAEKEEEWWEEEWWNDDTYWDYESDEYRQPLLEKIIAEAKRMGAEEVRKQTEELLRKSNDAMQRLLNVYGKPAGAGEK